MSADMMIVCKEDNSSYTGRIEPGHEGTDKAFCIDETSMGSPHTPFGEWFGERFCGAPGILEQMHGLNEHRYTKLTEPDVEAILKQYDSLEHKDYLGREKLEEYLRSHIGKHISTENW